MNIYQPSFASVNEEELKEPLLEGIWQYSDGGDVLNFRDALRLSGLHDYSKHFMEKVASYTPQVFVDMFLEMYRTGRRKSAHRTIRMVSCKIEYDSPTHDENGKPINKYTRKLAARFQRFFGQSPRELSILFHRLSANHPGVKSKHLLWACWELKQNNTMGGPPHSDVASFLNYDEAGELSNAENVMEDALGVIEQLAGLFDATAPTVLTNDAVLHLPFSAFYIEGRGSIGSKVGFVMCNNRIIDVQPSLKEVHSTFVRFWKHPEEARLEELRKFFCRFYGITYYKHEHDDNYRIHYAKAVAYFANNQMASQHGLVLDEAEI
jgi:hypothetical protein